MMLMLKLEENVDYTILTSSAFPYKKFKPCPIHMAINNVNKKPN